MMNSYMRAATAALVLAAICNPSCLGWFGSGAAMAAAQAPVDKSAIIVPAGSQVDAFGYSASSGASTSDTGSLIASSSLIGAVPAPIVLGPTLAQNNVNVAPAEAASTPTTLSWMPSTGALSSLRANDLGTQSLKSLYQLGRLTNPAQPHLDATIFGGGLAAEDYYLTDEGIQLEQSITEGIGIVGRATGYQLWIEKNASSPLAPSNKTVNRLNFGRFEGGLDLSPIPGFNFVLLGGHDVGDSDAWVIEADISAWFLLSSAHPFNIFVAPVHDFQNDVTSSEIDFRVVATQTPDWILLLGAGGQVFGGGFISGVEGEGGPIIGVYNRLYQLGADLQFGYGSPGVYGELNIYKTFSFPGL